MTVDKSPEKIRGMFDSIAGVYDKNNNLISLGLHKLVKHLAIKEFKLQSGMKIFDLCCGTGDIVGVFREIDKSLDITGIDFSDEMLKIARNRYPDVKFIKSDITELEIENSSADVITIAFGLRNINERDIAIRKIYQTLKKGGQFLHLDFGVHNIFSGIFDIIVKFGIFLTGKDVASYNYLINSKGDYPEPKLLINEFTEAGFKLIKRKDFLFGVISMQIFTK